MTRFLAAALLLAGCGGPPPRPFVVGVRDAATAADAVAARRLGLAVLDEAATASVAEVPASRDGRIDDLAVLRLRGARAVVGGAAGVVFVLPAPPPGRALVDYPEEWQALARAGRELLELRPVLESGPGEEPPFAVPAGVLGRAWTRGGRRYVLLVNDGARPAPFEPDALVPWRALFQPRADAREALSPCGAALCLEPGRALWLEGRPLGGS